MILDSCEALAESDGIGVFVTTAADASGANWLEKGKLVCENSKLLRYRLSKNERTFCKMSKEDLAQPKCMLEEIEADWQNEQHVGVLKAFAGKILHGTPLVAENPRIDSLQRHVPVQLAG